jgi:Rho GDP-dissociation inhibitor
MEEEKPIKPPVKPPKKPPKNPPTINVEIIESNEQIIESNDNVNVEKNVFKFSETSSNNVAEILATDSADESLQRYKLSLLGAAAQGDLGNISDPRKLIVCEFCVIFDPEEGRENIVHNLDTQEGLDKLKTEGIKMKEGAKFKFRVGFKVQHEILVALTFTNTVSKMMMSEEEELMIGSYPPASTAHTFLFPNFDYNEAPKGMLFRGKYKCKCSFVDASKVKHLEFEYGLQIDKTW